MANQKENPTIIERILNDQVIETQRRETNKEIYGILNELMMSHSDMDAIEGLPVPMRSHSLRSKETPEVIIEGFNNFPVKIRSRLRPAGWSSALGPEPIGRESMMIGDGYEIILSDSVIFHANNTEATNWINEKSTLEESQSVLNELLPLIVKEYSKLTPVRVRYTEAKFVDGQTNLPVA